VRPRSAPAIFGPEAALESEASVAESTTTPSELVQPLTELLLATLATSGGDHDRAEFLLRYENPAHKHTALGGGVLRAVGPATGEASWEDSAEIDFPDAHPRKTMWNLARRAIEIGVPIRTLHLDGVQLGRRTRRLAEQFQSVLRPGTRLGIAVLRIHCGHPGSR
jgi:hypothetical protein